MNTRRLSIFVLLVVILVTGCAPAATRAPATTPLAVAPRNPSQYPTQAPEIYRPNTQAPAATMAPAATSMPYLPAAPLPLDNQFQSYGTNPYTDTRADHLSTFGLDVDTASYTVARRYLMDGSLPPQEAIRPEEFINFFDAGYNPPPQAAFALYAEGAPSPFYPDGTIVLRVGVQGYKVPESQREPVTLTFVIDISGSMNLDNRLGLVKSALQVLVDRLRPQDSVGVVVFGTTARIALPPTSIERKDIIIKAINSLRTEGSTNAEAGLRLGYQQAMKFYRAKTTNKVILCSDGVANTGLTDPDGMPAVRPGLYQRRHHPEHLRFWHGKLQRCSAGTSG